MHKLRISPLKPTPFVWFFSITISFIILAGGAYYLGTKPKAQAQTRLVISSYSMQPDDFVPLTQRSDLVIEGVIKEIQPAIWTTSDGLPPADVVQALNDPTIQLRTPILVLIERAIKGKVTGELLFTQVGGETALYKIETEDNRSLIAGNRILVFLSKAPKDAGPWSKISPYYPQFYFIVQGDRLVGTQKVIQRSDLDQQLSTLGETH
jgi:hypothetical protein